MIEIIIQSVTFVLTCYISFFSNQHGIKNIIKKRRQPHIQQIDNLIVRNVLLYNMKAFHNVLFFCLWLSFCIQRFCEYIYNKKLYNRKCFYWFCFWSEVSNLNWLHINVFLLNLVNIRNVYWDSLCQKDV